MSAAPIARGAGVGVVRRLVRPRSGGGSGQSLSTPVCAAAGWARKGAGDGYDRLTTSCVGVELRNISSNANASAASFDFVTYKNAMRQSSYERRAFRALSTAASPTDEDSDADEDEDANNNDGLESLPDISAAMRNRIRAMKSRHDEVMSLLQDGGDQTKLGKELSSLSGISSLCDKVSEIHAERSSLLELLGETESSNDEDSKEMIDEINEELSQLDARLLPFSQKMLQFVVPLLDPNDVEDLTSSDAVIDIRAGTGGDEACLFAGEIMAAYEAIAKAGGGDEMGGGKSWEVEVLSVSRTDLGGIKDASLVVSTRGGGGGGGGGYGGYDSFDDGNDSSEGDTTQERLLRLLGPYGFFQYESGVHRVQRVPVNDVKMQTSAVSVAVLPSLSDSKVAEALPPSELKIETMRASGAGGQHVNTTDSACRVTHIPTGIMAYMQEERSQHKNKDKALKLVAARVHQLRKEQAARDRSDARSSLMGGGDRSERIRTYNFPQDRITDHRCKVTVQGVGAWLGGGTMVRKFGPHLYEMEREERVLALEEEDEKAREEVEKRKKSAGGGKGKGGKRR